MSMSEWVKEIRDKGKYDLYTNKKKIGVGGFSRVYSVERNGLKYALKEPKMDAFEEEEFDDGTIGSDRIDFTESFMREMEVWANLTDTVPDDVVCLIDCNKTPYPWMVMELAECDYSKAIKDGTAGPKDLIGLLDSLQRIHETGVVHRDIKPKNIMKVNGKWKFSDFGLSKMYNSSSTTGTGKGTAMFMAPEQVSKKYGTIDRSTDIWQMGILLYSVLTNGRSPYKGETDSEIIAEIITDGPDISEAPAEYHDILKRALSMQKEDRYESALEFSSELSGSHNIIVKEEEPHNIIVKDEEPHNIIVKDEETTVINGCPECDESLRSLSPYNKGEAYYFGDGVKQSYEKAFEWYKYGAELGNAESQYSLGEMYREGIGVQQSDEEALKWYRLAAEQVEHAISEDAEEGIRKIEEKRRQISSKVENTGNNGSNPVSTSEKIKEYMSNADYFERIKSYDKAFSNYKMAAELGDAKAQLHVGLSYDLGHGVEKSENEAFKWFLKSAEQGHAWSMTVVGRSYKDGGCGCEQSDTKAIYWLTKAAEAGNSDAQNTLGTCYYNGECTAQSFSEAAKWFRKAADQYIPEAQYTLATMYRDGKGVEQSNKDAIYWFAKATDQGHEKAKNELKSMKKSKFSLFKRSYNR